MEEWKKITGRFRDAESYSHTTESPNGNVWLTMFKTPREIRLFGGFTGNYELPIIVISCGNDEKNFIKIEPYIQNVISCSPESSPFSMIPGAERINGGVIKYGEALAVLIRRQEEKKHLIKSNGHVAIAVEVTHKQKKPFHRNAGKREDDTPPAPPPIIMKPEEDYSESKYEARAQEDTMSFVPIEIGEGLPLAASTAEEIFEEESAEDIPIANSKKLELTQEQFLDLMMGIKTRNPTRFDIPWDLRLIVWNPPYDKKEQEGNNSPKKGPARWTYKVTFGRFFKENMCDFKTVLVGDGYPQGKKETVLLFDNEMFRDNEAVVELSRSGNGERKKMTWDVTKAKFGSLLVDFAGLKVNQALGFTSVFTWDVFPIELKGRAKDSNDSMYLINMKSRSFKGQQDPADQEEENNPS